MGLKGRRPTAEERLHMARVNELGCVVCYNLGFGKRPCEIHHVYGKIKKGTHLKVLPLCFEHHRMGSDKEPISRHPYKKRFVEAYGTEETLLNQVDTMLEESVDTYG